jgi:large subunit ribosomal protein L7A
MSYEKVERAKEVIVGVKQTLRAIEKNEAKEVVLAYDADRRLTQRVLLLCKEKGVPVTYVDSMERLGKVAGIQVGAAAVTVKKSG